ncbi:MAG: T9SS type A sorting domain-containing protein [Vicingaceae bacterium]|nr:T9SS type A sorting domain-containing protein [Vicingaceae bacterium]
MKKIVSLLISILFCHFIFADILLNESFTAGVLPAGWTNTAQQGTAIWTIRNAPAFSSPSGGNYIVFDDLGLGSAVTPNEATLRTPTVNFSNRNTAFLKISHHWFGVEFTHGYIEISNNGGVSWTQLIDYEKLTRGSLAAPQDTIFDITAIAANQANVQVRFRYTDGGQAGRYWYLDDIVLYSNPDVGVSKLVLPPYLGCAQTYGAAQTVTVEIRNFSFEPVTNIPVTCQVTGGTTATLTGTYSGPLIPGGGTANFTFATTINMTADAIYHFLSYTTLTNDSYNLNDTLFDGRQQLVATYPYTANFNISNSGWLATGQAPPLNNGRNFIHGNVPYLNGSQGQGKSWYIESTAPYYTGTQIWVESPVFDFTGLISPQLSMDIKHSLHSSDWVKVEYSTNGGTSWTQLGNSSSPNWYNQTNYWANSQAAPVDAWTQVQHNLCMLAGQACVKFRVLARPYYGNPNYPTWYNFAFDNFTVREGIDVGVLTYIDPVDVGCLFNTTQQVTVTVYNGGCNPITNVPIQCDITGQITTTLTGTVPGPIPVGGTVSYTFPTTFNMVAVGTYNFNTYTQLVGDINSNNDTLATSINVTNLKVTTYPYFEDFNSGAGFWNASGQNPPGNGGRNWVLGNVPYLGGPQGNGDSWYIETVAPYYDGTQIWVESPVFDFTNLTNPKLSFDIKHSLHSSDWVKVEYSTNGGTTWVQLGNGPNATWYNQTNYWANSQAAPVATWTNVEQELCALSGEPCVKFRILARPYYGNPNYPNWYNFAFDNFEIDAGHPDDMQPLEIILSDSRKCASFGTAETIRVVVANNTCRPLYNVPISLQLNGGPIITETMPGPVPSFGNYIYTFTNTLDLSPAITHNISVTTLLATDSFPANDNLVETRINTILNTFPYLADFNTNNDGWVSRINSTTNASRLFINDTIPYLNGSQGQGKSWYIESTAPYYTGTQIWVESPVFNFSALTSPQLSFDIKHSLHSSDWVKVEYSINGGTSWTQLGNSSSPNWYNQTNYWANSQANPVDAWTQVQHNLCMLVGQACVKFRVLARPYYGNPNYPNWYNFAFDNFYIREGGDVGVVAYIEPLSSGCLYDTAQQVTVRVFNGSCNPISNVPIQCDITGILATTLTDTVPGPIPVGGFVNYTFPTTINMTPIGTYNFNTFTLLPGDINPNNDTLATSINVSQITISTFPYYEDFNSGNGYWLASGQAPPVNGGRNWVLGNVPYLGGSQGNGDSWYIETTAPYYDGTQIWVESPVFDFTNLLNPQLSFDIKHSLHSSDWVRIQYSTNGGTTWTTLGSGPNATWYNQTTGWWNSQGSPVDTWTRMERDLCTLVGQSCVKFRILARPYYGNPNYPNWYNFAFDNFHITDTPLDAALTLVASCWGSQYEIEATVTNNALPCTATPILSSFDITYSVDGGTPVTVQFTGQNIAGGTSETVILTNTTVPNNNSTVVAWINFPNTFNDQIFQNDTAYGYAVSWPNCNDHCSNAIDLGLGTTTATQTSNATVNLSEEPAFSGCGGITLENTVWYQFTTNSSGDSVTIVFDNQVCSPSQNGIQVSIVQATVSCDPMTYTEIFCSASNDTTAFQFGPTLLPPNTTYYIAVDGFAGSDCDFDITITGAVNPPLPIELISFDAACAPTNGAVDLKWLSATEINNDFYTIERSSDAINFEVVATIKGAGNSNNVNSYFFRDVNPINGTSYYRLKQTDFNGNFEYFNVVVVNCTSKNEISLYPNPANNEFTVQLEGKKGDEVNIEIYNSIGQQVMNRTFILQHKFFSEQIDVNEFDQGIYFVNIKMGNLLIPKKLIIDRKR